MGSYKLIVKFVKVLLIPRKLPAVLSSLPIASVHVVNSSKAATTI